MAVTVSARVPEELHGRLTILSQALRRSRSELIEEAIRAYVESEIQSIEAVERGRADARAGRVTDHDAFMAELDALIDQAGQ
jgi:predicted transcriptional regulator